MIAGQIDRGRQDDGAPAGGAGEGSEELVAGDHRRAAFYGAQEFPEIFAGDRATMFLFPEHDRVIEIENDVRIGLAQEEKFERAKAERLEEKNDIVPARLPNDLELADHAGTPGGQDGRFHAEARIGGEAFAEAEARAGGIPVFNNAKCSHGVRKVTEGEELEN